MGHRMTREQPWKKLWVCLDVCMSPKPCQWHGPSEEPGHDWGGHWVKAALSGSHYPGACCHARLLGQCWELTHRDQCLGVGGVEEGHVPAAEPPSSSAWRDREWGTPSIWLHQAGPSFPPQDKGLQLCSSTWKELGDCRDGAERGEALPELPYWPAMP